MSLYPYSRSIIWTSVCLAAALVAPVSFGASPVRQQASAQLLDHAEILCDNCFFGASSYYYCFAVDNQILIGHLKTPVMNWEDPSKNYLATVRGAWGAWIVPGQTVPISYDDKHIWVSRPEKKVKRPFWSHMRALAAWVTRDNRKQVRMARSSVRDVFIHDDRCRAAVGTKAH